MGEVLMCRWRLWPVCLAWAPRYRLFRDPALVATHGLVVSASRSSYILAIPTFMVNPECSWSMHFGESLSFSGERPQSRVVGDTWPDSIFAIRLLNFGEDFPITSCMYQSRKPSLQPSNWKLSPIRYHSITHRTWQGHAWFGDLSPTHRIAWDTISRECGQRK